MYQYRFIKDWKLLWDGDFEVQVLHPKVQVQFTQTNPNRQSEEEAQQRVDAFRIWSPGFVRVMVRGLGNLTQAVSLYLTGFLNRNIDSFMPHIEEVVRRVIP